MFELFESFCLGLAAAVHTVLLLVVLERTNRPLTAVWLKWALTGATLWHVSCFFHVLLRDTTGGTAGGLDILCMTTMAAGLLLLTCGILHAAVRINRSGPQVHPDPHWRYAVIYSPLLFLPAIAVAIARSQTRDFLAATADYHLPYLAWTTFANLSAAWLFFRNRHHPELMTTAAGFMVRFAACLVGVTVLVAGYVTVGANTSAEPILRLLTSVSPLAPTLVFAWYVFRRRLLPVVFERPLAYGALLLAVFYLHRLTLSPVMRKLSDEFQFDFYVAEALLLAALVLAWQPLRKRVTEGLRYLVSEDITELRDATSSMSVDLSRRASDPAESTVSWFVSALRDALRLSCVRLVIQQPEALSAVAVAEDCETDSIAADDNLPLAADITSRWIDRARCSHAALLAAMRDADLIAIVPVRYRDVSGVLLLGTPRSGDRLFDEQLNSVAMLADQLAATLHNRRLDAARQLAERSAAQQDKLSVLGLVSGSLAHELRNPLSSIRTIATLLREDVSENESQTREIDLIVSEIDRLTGTTQQLLDFSRPPDCATAATNPDRVISRLMKILNHLARQHGVTIEQRLHAGASHAAITESALTDIVFNLIRNAIEAVRNQTTRRVVIETRRLLDKAVPRVMIRIEDSGPGVSEDIRAAMYEPFVTDKPDGTGLGLYLVAERVREFHGTVDCRCNGNCTVFEVTLPATTAAENTSADYRVSP